MQGGQSFRGGVGGSHRGGWVMQGGVGHAGIGWVMLGWGVLCRVGWVMQGWGGSCIGGVCHAGMEWGHI